MTTSLTLAAIRYTDDVPAMRRFLETLSLATVSTRGDGWAVLRSGAGEVWLHEAKASETKSTAGVTDFTGDIQDLEAYVALLEEHDLTVSVVDEAYARTIEVADPTGRTLVLHERDDAYGYDRHNARPDDRVTVSMCRFTDPQGAYATFAEALGLDRQSEPNEWYVPYSAGTGTLGLHHDKGDPIPDNGTGPSVTLGFTTSIPLTGVQGMLRDAGYDAGTIRTEDHGSHLETTDPDGQPLLIHENT